MDTDNLKNNKVDYAASVARGVAGAVPLAGGLIAELVGSIIPNQRMDRIAKFLAILDQKLAELGEDAARRKLLSPGATALVEDAFLSAYRAHTDERRDAIASIVKNGIKPDQMKIVEAQRILSVLDQLNDAEIIVLKAYDRRWQPGEFLWKHGDLLLEETPTLRATKERREAYAIRQSYHSHLEQLGLIASKIEFEKNTWEEQKLAKTKPEITDFGEALINFIDGQK